MKMDLIIFKQIYWNFSEYIMNLLNSKEKIGDNLSPENELNFEKNIVKMSNIRSKFFYQCAHFIICSF